MQANKPVSNEAVLTPPVKIARIRANGMRRGAVWSERWKLGVIEVHKQSGNLSEWSVARSHAVRRPSVVELAAGAQSEQGTSERSA